MLVLTLSLTAAALTVASPVCTVQADNLLRFDCVTSTDAPARLRVKFWPDGTAAQTPTPWSSRGTSHTRTAWGLRSSRTYRAFAEASDPVTGATARSSVITFVTPALTGPPFDDLTLRAAARPGGAETVSYVLAPMGCSGAPETLIIADADGEVVWYEELPGGGDLVSAVETIRGGVLVQVDRRFLYEIAYDGTLVRTIDYGAAGECTLGQGPCPHHELRREGGQTWVGLAEEDAWSYGALGLSGCLGKRRYAIDGFRRYDPAWAATTDWWLDDYGWWPDTDPGPFFDPAAPTPGCEGAYWSGTLGDPDAPIDTTHVNAFDIEPGPAAIVSVSGFDQVARIDLAAGVVDWTLHATEAAWSSFATPISVDPSIIANRAARFSGQHHVQWVDGRLLMLDNVGAAYTRVLAIGLDEVAGVATMEQAYTLVDDDGGTWSSPAGMRCANRGSAYRLPSGTVLATCASAGTVLELDAADGTTTAGPLWSLEASCSAGGINGFYRALPVARLE